MFVSPSPSPREQLPLKGESGEGEADERVVSDASLSCFQTVRLLTSERLCGFNPASIRLLSSEKAELVDKLGHHPEGARYLVWRKTLLWVGMVFYTAVVALDSILLMATLSQSAPLFMGVVPHRYWQYFQWTLGYYRSQDVGIVLGYILSCLFAAMAAWNWKHFVRSANFLRLSFFFSYVTPFAVLLVIPWRYSVDIVSWRLHMCRDATNEVQALLAGFQPGLVEDIMGEYNINCQHFDAPAFVDRVIDRFRTHGMLEVNGSCPFMKSMTDGGFFDLVAMDPTCPAQCRDCTKKCGDWLVPLQAMVQSYGVENLPALTLRFASTLGGVKRCTHCFSNAPHFNCLMRCRSMQAMIASKVMDTAQSNGLNASRIKCMDDDDVANIRTSLELLVSTLPWEISIGGFFGLRSFRLLLPLTFSLFLGALSGGLIGDVMLPYSRVPRLIRSAATVFVLPTLMMVLVVTQNTFGSLKTLLATVGLFIFIVAYMGPTPLTANHEQAEKLEGQCFYVQIFSLIVFLVGIGWHAVTSCSEWEFIGVAEQILKDPTLQIFMQLSSVRMGLRMLAVFLGSGNISTVFFADSVLTMTEVVEQGNKLDAEATRQKRFQTLDTVSTLMGKPTAAREAVARTATSLLAEPKIEGKDMEVGAGRSGFFSCCTLGSPKQPTLPHQGA